MLDVALQSAGVLFVALAALIISSEIVVRSSVVIARYARISELAIGFIFLAIATTIPDLTVSLVAALDGFVNLAVGDALGGSVTAVLFVVGFTAFIAGTIAVKRHEMLDVIKILFITSILPLMLTLYRMSSFVVGIILLYVFFMYSYVVLKTGIAPEKMKREEMVTKRGAWIAFFGMVAGLVLLVASANFAVANAVKLSDLLGLSQTFVGATIMALATSLPEATVGILAMRKGHSSLAIGGLVGSSVASISMVLGFVALVTPFAIQLRPFLNVVIFLIIANIVLWYFLQTRGKITRKEALILLAIYVLYILSGLGVESGI
jgi:cation:H+ antiporter